MKSETRMQASKAAPSHNAERLQHYLRLNYPMEVVEDEDGIVATIPDLPGCVSFGETIEGAVRNLKEIKELWIKGRIDSGQPVPEPSDVEDFSGKFVLRIPKGLHKSLDREAKRQGVSLNQYILHLLSERHATAKIERALEQSTPFLADLQSCYLHRKDAWSEQTRIYQFTVSTGPSKALDSPESLLGMLDFLPKPKGFRKALPNQKDLRAVYEGKL
ncbi:MAG: type II toxin-antitoxin system HicB family antitoxin [Candidatus Sulfotelmatobacter sp.]